MFSPELWELDSVFETAHPLYPTGHRTGLSDSHYRRGVAVRVELGEPRSEIRDTRRIGPHGGFE